jgi:UPF0176 protein
MRYLVVAFYKLVSIENPALEVNRHKKFFSNRDVSGRIYLSEEGINAQMSGAEPDALAYIEWMKGDSRFADTFFKVQEHHENAFPRMTVKVREQLVALDRTVDSSQGGEHVSPAEWRRMLEEEQDVLLLDVRNQYEWEVGRFEGAIAPNCDTFRDYSDAMRQLKARVDPSKTKVMMYCTGGIRCELYSAVMREEGFENVYQLDGGVINYSEKEGGKHWEGQLFVFDDRLTVPVGDECPTIGTCRHCEGPTDHFVNCANMDCNELFLCCDPCLKEQIGCCEESCKSAERLRPFREGSRKPFRRLRSDGGSDQESAAECRQGQQSVPA